MPWGITALTFVTVCLDGYFDQISDDGGERKSAPASGAARRKALAAGNH